MTGKYELNLRMFPSRSQKIMWFMAGYFGDGSQPYTDTDMIDAFKYAIETSVDKEGEKP